MKRNEIHKLIQEYLKDPPLIIWGSGANIAGGLLSMNDLNNMLKAKFSFFDKDWNRGIIEFVIYKKLQLPQIYIRYDNIQWAYDLEAVD